MNSVGIGKNRRGKQYNIEIGGDIWKKTEIFYSDPEIFLSIIFLSRKPVG